MIRGISVMIFLHPLWRSFDEASSHQNGEPHIPDSLLDIAGAALWSSPK